MRKASTSWIKSVPSIFISENGIVAVFGDEGNAIGRSQILKVPLDAKIRSPSAGFQGEENSCLSEVAARPSIPLTAG